VALTVVSLLLAGACGNDDDFPVEGTSGTQVAATFPGWVPVIQAGVSAEDHTMIVDTGAPITICDRDSFPGFDKDGKHAVDMHGFGLTFPGYEVVSYDIFGGAPGGGSPDGIVGGDLLRHFAMRLDYQGGHAALYFGETAPPGDDALVFSDGASVPIEVIGGGLASLPGNCSPMPSCGTVSLPATRILLSARFEGASQAQWVLLDTGASAIATSESFLASLAGNGSPRPRLDGVNITTATGVQTAALSRVWRLDIEAGEADVVLDDLPLLVLPNDQLLQGISNEVGRPIVALVGGTFLREFLTTIDYPAERLVLERYRTRTHIPADEYVGVGFTLQGGASGTWLVNEVYPSTDAAAQGLVAGQVVEEIAGTSITGLPQATVEALFDGRAVGSTVAVGVVVAGNLVSKDVAVEDLLPDYGAP